MRLQLSALLATCIMLLAACSPTPRDARAPVVWKLDNTEKIGGLKAAVIGNAPEVCDGALRFDGKSQGLLLPAMPVAGWRVFTIELDIFPEAGGEFEQRFFHGGSSQGPRVMVELRSNPDGNWYLDTHIRDAAGRRMTLIDPKKTHPSGRWHTVRLVYDGKTMSHHVNGVLEGEAETDVAMPIPGSAVSLGVRQNRINWFKGMMREVRFWPDAPGQGSVSAQ